MEKSTDYSDLPIIVRLKAWANKHGKTETWQNKLLRKISQDTLKVWGESHVHTKELKHCRFQTQQNNRTATSPTDRPYSAICCLSHLCLVCQTTLGAERQIPSLSDIVAEINSVQHL